MEQEQVTRIRRTKRRLTCIHSPTSQSNRKRAHWIGRIGHLLTNLSNVLDSLEDSTAPNAMHAKVAVIEKIIDIVTNMEA